MSEDRGQSGGIAARGSWTPLWVLVVGLLAARLVYLKWLCPYALVEDEAQYWEWGKHLDWSYYTKGPGIAWVNALSSWLLGDSEFGVRAPAAIAAALATLGVGVLGTQVSGGNRRVGLWAAMLFQLTPLFQAIGLLSTIDGPYVACWAWACVLAWRAMEERGTWSWIGLGAMLALGFVFKYTIVLLIPGLCAYAWMRRGRMNLSSRWLAWMLSCVALALLGLAPVLIWNSQHQWGTVKHLLGRIGLKVEGVSELQTTEPAPWSWSPWWWPEFVGGQLGIVGPALVLGVCAAWAATKYRAADPSRWGPKLFLILAGAPVIGFYLLLSFVARSEGNWAMAGYITLLTLGGWWAMEGMDTYRVRLKVWLAKPKPRPHEGFLMAKPEMVPQVLWHAVIAWGLIAGLGMLRVDLAAKLPLIGPYVPIGRLTRGPDLAREVENLRRELRAKQNPGSAEPMVFAINYGLASHLAFYLPREPGTLPLVYCASSKYGGRPTQHEFWSSHNLDDPKLIGRDAVLVGEIDGHWEDAFTRVEGQGTIPGQEKREVIAFFGFGYRGFPRSRH